MVGANTAAAGLGANEPCWCGSGSKYKKCHRAADDVAVRKGQAVAMASRIRPGKVSPMRSVPPQIVRPDYAESGTPSPPRFSDVKDEARLARLKVACRAAAELLKKASLLVKPGVTTDEIDALVHDETIRMGGYPSTLNYHGFRKALCTSVNEVICHGIPDDRALQDGDIVNLDISIFIEGMHGDTNATFFVGQPSEAAERLVRVTRECLQKGIEAVNPGKPINEIGRAIEAHASKAGYGVVREYCGHGIGETFHTGLQIPHFFDPEADLIMEPGLVFTIEPMITEGSPKLRHWDDGWTVVTVDGKKSAQFEHTIVVTERGAEVLTAP